MHLSDVPEVGHAQPFGAAVVDQHDVHLGAGARRAEVRGVLRDRRAQRAAREHPHEDAEILDARDRASRCRPTRCRACGTFTLRSALPSLVQTTMAAGLGDGEVGAGHAGLGARGSTGACSGAGFRRGSAGRCCRDRCRWCARRPRPRPGAACAPTAPRCGWAARRRAAGCARRGRSRSPSMPRCSRKGRMSHSSVSIDLALTSVLAPRAAHDVEHDLVVLDGVAPPSARGRRSRWRCVRTPPGSRRDG